ncbi:hypothetical protein DSM3645_02031 [Blastopirellula marina DSM 3645]|uniref:Transposase n=1 Tax=Blastopirellula marina DSM 3645 TaxID=314230 RepID=A4A0P1_9BACT|nr:hypothetical protein DSM3645_02031 [Blastopirellula marina DSM 3645]
MRSHDSKKVRAIQEPIEGEAIRHQSLYQRIATAAELQRECVAWDAERNALASKVCWHFSTDDARRPLLPNVWLV